MSTDESPGGSPGDGSDDEDGFGSDEDGFGEDSTTTTAEANGFTPRPMALFIDSFDRFYEEFQAEFTDSDDETPRKAFVQEMVDRGVVFPNPTSEFGDTDANVGNYGVVTGGEAGANIQAVSCGIEFNADLVDGFHDRRQGWRLNARAARNPVLRVIDTEDVAEEIEGAAPDDAADLVEAMLAQYDFVDERGSGNDVVQGLENLLQRPAFLKWFFEALTMDGKSVIEAVAGLGGGTGSALVVLVADWARMGIIGTENQSLGFTTTSQLGRSLNDVTLGSFEDGSPRTTWHDAVAAESFLSEQVREGNADWYLHMDNLSLTYAHVGINENPDLSQIRRFWEPVRSAADPCRVERRIVRELGDDVNDHDKRNRVAALAVFPFRRLQARDAAVRFNVGKETYDDADFRQDFHEHIFTPAFDAVNSYDEFEDRGIPRFNGVKGHKDALHALSHTAAALPTSFVSHDEIYGANAVVHAADMDIGLDELGLIREEVADELNLGDGGRSVRAISMDGLTADRFPGDFPLAMTVFAKHTAPVEAHVKMSSEDYNRRVNGGE